MNLSALVIQKLVEELRPKVMRRLIRDAVLVQKNDLYLNLGDAGFLLCSAQPGRSHIRFANPPNSTTQPQPDWLLHHVAKSGIMAINHIPNERIIELTLSKHDRLGTQTQYRLICELIGRYANVILVDPKSEKILGALRHVTSRNNRFREILPGRPYQAPPAQHGVMPQSADSHTISQALTESPDQPAQALQNAIAGLDYLTACELWHQSQQTPDPQAQLPTLIRDFFAQPPFLDGATLIADDHHRQHLCVIPITYTTPVQSFPSVTEAIEALLSVQEVQDVLRSRQKNIEKDLQNRLDAITKKQQHIQTDLEDATRADEYEKFGNILMANLQRIPPGATTISLPDLFDDQDQTITIPLNPNRTPVENASDYLKKGRKGRKGYPILKRRLDTTYEQSQQIETYLKRLNACQTEEDLDALFQELEDQGLCTAPKKNRPSQQKKRAEEDIHPRRYRTRDGWIVLVGRNNKENDKLTKSASRDDVFFHAHGCPGSHVILKQDGRGEKPPRSTVKEAASLAAYWSKARTAKTVPVSYTEVRYVQKPKGAPPGLVTIRNEKSIMVEPREIQKEDDFDA